MRRVFLLLLLLNVVFFTWQINRANAVYDPYADRLKPDADQMRGVRTIYLLSEVGRTPRAAVSRPAPAHDVPVPEVASLAQTRCFRAGPLASAKRAGETAQRLGEHGITAAVTVEEEPVATMHWVSLPPFPTFDAAKKQFAELQKRGVTDLGIVNERPGYVVSLGFYRQRESAQRRHDEISALGHAPRITERLTTKPVYWLDFRRLADDETSAATLATLLIDIPTYPRDCAAAPLADSAR